MNVGRRAHITCETCNALLYFDKEDIQEEKEDDYDYHKSESYIITTSYVICPVCGSRTNIKVNKQRKSKSSWGL